MGEAAAVKRAEEPTKVVKYTSLFDQIDETFNTLARRAYEIFDWNGRVFGRDLEDWFQAEREILHPVALNITDDHRTARIHERGKERKDGLCRESLGPNPESRELTGGN